MAKWKIHTPKPAEAPAIAAFQAEAWRDTYSIAGNEARNALVAQDAASFELPLHVDRRRRILQDAAPWRVQRIAKVGSEVVGLLYGVTIAPEQTEQELCALYVAKNLHGRGIGRGLVDAYKNECNPAHSIDVGVAKDNIKAQGFYRKMGFKAAGTRPFENCPYIPTEIIMRIEAGRTKA